MPQRANDYDRQVEDVVADLRQMKASGRKCVLLLGAGCSSTANIPVASDLAMEIGRRRRSAAELSYPDAMDALGVLERRDLIREYIRKSRMNWAHVGVAALIQAGYVDRVLTTNFDPLVVVACAMVGVHPAVYDFAASQFLYPEELKDDPAVFYLHGQHTGFLLMNTKQETQALARKLPPLFKSCQGHLWIVVGYSGANDPVFKQMVACRRPNYPLYWVGYLNNPPAPHVEVEVLGKKYAYHVRRLDADRFFVEVARGLDCFPPSFVGKPFSHLLGLLEQLPPMPQHDRRSAFDAVDVLAQAKRLVKRAADKYERQVPTGARPFPERNEPAAGILLYANELQAAGDYRSAIRLGEMLDRPELASLADVVAWGFVQQSRRLRDEAVATPVEQPEVRNALFEQAYESFRQALELKPANAEALNGWGATLVYQARSAAGADADRLFELARVKYEEALSLGKEKGWEMYDNWGLAFMDQADQKEAAGLTAEAERLRGEAERKFLDAEKIKHGSAAYNLACLHAIMEHEALCKKWLDLAIERDRSISAAMITTDPDLQRYRDTDWFKGYTRGWDQRSRP